MKLRSRVGKVNLQVKRRGYAESQVEKGVLYIIAPMGEQSGITHQFAKRELFKDERNVTDEELWGVDDGSMEIVCFIR